MMMMMMMIVQFMSDRSGLNRFKVSSKRLEKLGIEPKRLYHFTTEASISLIVGWMLPLYQYMYFVSSVMRKHVFVVID